MNAKSRIIAILDNGKGKRGFTCDDCGVSLRFEYHLENGGRFGSCCVKAHLAYNPNWLTLKAEKDAKTFAMIDTGLKEILPILKRYSDVIYNEYSDGSLNIPGLGRFWHSAHQAAIEALKEEGWKSILWRDERGYPMIAHFTRKIMRSPEAYAIYGDERLESVKA